MRLDTVDQQLINHYQRNLPVCERPYREMADTLGISEDEVISRLAVLQQQQVLSRVGPVFEHSQAGASLLAAVAAPVEQPGNLCAVRVARGVLAAVAIAGAWCGGCCRLGWGGLRSRCSG